MYNRMIDLRRVKGSFFLWGPRQTGKTSLLREQFPDSIFIDLLKTDLLIRYQTAPWLLREELEGRVKPGTSSPRVIIDEVQKVPALLDEVHWLIENRKLAFGLCGSSARKVRRGAANLLGGRAFRFELFGLTSVELGVAFDLVKIVNRGYLPRIFDDSDFRDSLRVYTSEYLREEIAAEGLIRNLPSFNNFLEMASLSDTEQLNFATIARDVGVSPPTVRSYFQILEDTLIGSFLPAYRKRPKRRTVESPKFFFFDVGMVNSLAKRGVLEPGGELFGKAFENFIFHELSAYRSYRKPQWDLSYWKLSSGTEVDFIIGDMAVALEAKASKRITSDHLKGLREIETDYPRLKHRVCVSLESQPRKLSDGIEILPVQVFLKRLWDGQFDTL